MAERLYHVRDDEDDFIEVSIRLQFVSSRRYRKQERAMQAHSEVLRPLSSMRHLAKQ